MKVKRGILRCSFIALCLAAVLCSTAVCAWNGPSEDLEINGDTFQLRLMPVVYERSMDLNTSGTWSLRLFPVEYDNAPVRFDVQAVKNSGTSKGIAMNGTKVFANAIYFPKPTMLSKTDAMTYASKTGYLYFSINVESYVSVFDIADSVTTQGASFVVVQELGDLTRFTWGLAWENGEDNTAFNDLYEQFWSDGFYLNFPVQAVKSTVSDGDLESFYLSYAYFGNTPDFVPDADNTTIIVESIEALEDAFDASIQAGVTEIESVIVQQTDAITGAVEEQTEVLLDYRSDVDMSVEENVELAVQVSKEKILNQLVIDQYEPPEYDKNLDASIDSSFGGGVSFVADLMQQILDIGFGELVIILLTIGTALFIIGRSV